MSQPTRWIVQRFSKTAVLVTPCGSDAAARTGPPHTKQQQEHGYRRDRLLCPGLLRPNCQEAPGAYADPSADDQNDPTDRHQDRTHWPLGTQQRGNVLVHEQQQDSGEDHSRGQPREQRQQHRAPRVDLLLLDRRPSLLCLLWDSLVLLGLSLLGARVDLRLFGLPPFRGCLQEGQRDLVGLVAGERCLHRLGDVCQQGRRRGLDSIGDVAVCGRAPRSARDAAERWDPGRHEQRLRLVRRCLDCSLGQARPARQRDRSCLAT